MVKLFVIVCSLASGQCHKEQIPVAYDNELACMLMGQQAIAQVIDSDFYVVKRHWCEIGAHA